MKKITFILLFFLIIFSSPTVSGQGYAIGEQPDQGSVYEANVNNKDSFDIEWDYNISTFSYRRNIQFKIYSVPTTQNCQAEGTGVSATSSKSYSFNSGEITTAVYSEIIEADLSMDEFLNGTKQLFDNPDSAVAQEYLHGGDYVCHVIRVSIQLDVLFINANSFIVKIYNIPTAFAPLSPVPIFIAIMVATILRKRMNRSKIR